MALEKSGFLLIMSPTRGRSRVCVRTGLLSARDILRCVYTLYEIRESQV